MNIPGYTINGTLGEGGMATIFKGVQDSLNRPVAIKVLKDSVSQHETVRELFRQESLIIAKLHHPHIIQVIDQGITQEGRPYFIMPFIKGINLKAAFGKASLSVNRALDMFAQIAKALSYAHKNDVVHCDIKPENIMVDFEGDVRVLDFGISQLASKLGKQSGNEQELMMGSEAYMSPEQQLGISKATTKSDIYSLGVLMYLYFNKRLPQGQPQDRNGFGAEVPVTIVNLILDCLNPAPGKRPESAEAIKVILLRALQGEHLDAGQKERAQSDLKKSFSLLDVIKEDSHGAVYLFEEQTSKSFIVIKKKPNSIPGYQEAKKLTKVKHPNIAQLFGTSKNERVFILVQEYCRGGALADQLARKYSLEEFTQIALSIAKGMSAAHERGITHGNLRPSNVLFDENGQVKIVDFGLREHYADSQQNWYSCKDEPASKQADIFSVGVIFYQMLMGEEPDTKVTLLMKKRRFAQLPQYLQKLIRGMLQKDPQKRIQSMHTVIDLLHHPTEDEPTVIQQVAPMVAHAPLALKESIHATRRPYWLALILLVVFSSVVTLQGHFILSGGLEKVLVEILY